MRLFSFWAQFPMNRQTTFFCQPQNSRAIGRMMFKGPPKDLLPFQHQITAGHVSASVSATHVPPYQPSNCLRRPVAMRHVFASPVPLPPPPLPPPCTCLTHTLASSMHALASAMHPAIHLREGGGSSPSPKGGGGSVERRPPGIFVLGQ